MRPWMVAWITITYRKVRRHEINDKASPEELIRERKLGARNEHRGIFWDRSLKRVASRVN